MTTRCFSYVWEVVLRRAREPWWTLPLLLPRTPTPLCSPPSNPPFTTLCWMSSRKRGLVLLLFTSVSGDYTRGQSVDTWSLLRTNCATCRHHPRICLNFYWHKNTRYQMLFTRVPGDYTKGQSDYTWSLLRASCATYSPQSWTWLTIIYTRIRGFKWLVSL